MKVCGFTIAKNAVRFDYPIVEAIESILPVCDAFIVAVGDSNDGTRDLIASIAEDRISILDTVWDPSLKEGGKVLAAETNKALNAVPPDFDWCFYIQADEVVHEHYLPAIRAAMEEHLDNPAVDGLLFRYRHFYGTFDYVADSRRWYRHEIRIVRNDRTIRSWNDAQGFRRANGTKLTAAHSGAEMYHYGWVRPPRLMKDKVDGAKAYWAPDSKHIRSMDRPGAEFSYEQNFDSLDRFEGSHPRVMHDPAQAPESPALATLLGREDHRNPAIRESALREIPRCPTRATQTALTERFRAGFSLTSGACPIEPSAAPD
jgi:hypothetical protein